MSVFDFITNTTGKLKARFQRQSVDAGVVAGQSGNNIYNSSFNVFNFNTEPYSGDYYQNRKLFRDDVFNFCVNELGNLISNSHYNIIGLGAKQEHIDFVQGMFDNLDLAELINDMLLALVYGFSCNEIIYDFDEVQKKIVVRRFVNIPNVSLNNGLDSFIFDKQGEFSAVRQSPSGFSGSDDVIIPFEKVVMFAFRNSGGNILGQPLTMELCDIIQQRQMTLNNLKVFIFRHIMPIVYSRTEMITDQTKSELVHFMQDVLNGKAPALTLGQQDSIEILETQQKVTAFTDSLDVLERTILRKCMMSNYSESKYGNYSTSLISSVDNKKSLNSIVAKLNKVIQKQVVEKVCDINFPDIKPGKYPIFNINEITEQNIEKLIYVLNSASLDLSNGDWYPELVSEAITYYSSINVEPKDIRVLSPEELAALKSGGGGAAGNVGTKQGAPVGSAGLPSATSSKNNTMKSKEGTKARGMSPTSNEIESTAKR
jgi:hypothetical protein